MHSTSHRKDSWLVKDKLSREFWRPFTFDICTNKGLEFSRNSRCPQTRLRWFLYEVYGAAAEDEGVRPTVIDGHKIIVRNVCYYFQILQYYSIRSTMNAKPVEWINTNSCRKGTDKFAAVYEISWSAAETTNKQWDVRCLDEVARRMQSWSPLNEFVVHHHPIVSLVNIRLFIILTAS